MPRAAFPVTITGPRRWNRGPSTSRPTAASRSASPSASPGGTSNAMPGNEPFETWEEVAEFALGLPDTELSSSYGRPAVKVRGKAFVYPGREKGSFALATPIGEKELLMETEPDTFWETPHYRGWPAVLVRYGSPSRER